VIITLPEVPPSTNVEYGSILARASAALSMGAANALHWLLGSGPGCICCGAWPTGTAMTDRRIYHDPSPNARGVVVCALIETQGEQGTNGTITFTPAGGGDAVTGTFIDASRGRFDGVGWHLWIRTAYLAGAAYQYHTVSWSDLGVRKLSVWELPRTHLNTATMDGRSDTLILRRAGSYAGTEALRQITDSSTAGIAAYLTATASARDSHKRHLNWFVADGDAWEAKPSDTQANLADDALGGSDVGFIHCARWLKAAHTGRKYTATVRAKWTDAGAATSAKVILASKTDEATFGSITTSWAYHTPDLDDTLTIGCQEDDLIIPQAMLDDADEDSTVHLTGLSLVEEDD